MFVVPSGVDHKPTAYFEGMVMAVESNGVAIAGDTGSELREITKIGV